MMSVLPSIAFFHDLASGMAVNFLIAGTALGLGLALGLPLGVLPGKRRWLRGLATALVGLMRAAPTFVVMFFLLNVIPADAQLLGVSVAPAAWLIVALSLVPYAAAYAADNGSQAVAELRRGARDSALLFLPNILRAFFVLVMASSAGAAIGVSEGVAVVLREAERMPNLGDKAVIFATGVVCFGVVFQAGFALMRALSWRLRRR